MSQLALDTAAEERAIRNLVCKHCWDKLFSTPAFWEVCKYAPSAETDGHEKPEAKYRSHLKSYDDDCNWCLLIGLLTIWALPDGDDDLAYFITLEPVPSTNYTPDGRNLWNISTTPDNTAYGSYGNDFSAYTVSSDAAAPYVTARPLEADVSSVSAMLQIKRWLDECKEHKGCPAQTLVQLPTRVIDVGRIGTSALPKLQETSHELGQYATLSYCWGGPQSAALKQENLLQYREGLDMRALPQTIKDAIVVARGVEIQYLWIDSLCIIQDSDEDKLREISVMDEIYGNSLINIAASSASFAHEGFLQPRQFPSSYHVPYRCPDGAFGTMNLCDLQESSTEPLAERGWAFQEAILPPRTVEFNSDTLQWACLSGRHNLGDSFCRTDQVIQDYDSVHMQLPASVGATSEEASSIRQVYYPDQWFDIVHDYSRRNLSFPGDKLVALSGVVKEMASTLETRYLAGLWNHSLLMQLTWRVVGDHMDKQPRPVYRAPSWSWASVDGQVLYIHSRDPTDDTFCCKILDCETVPESVQVPFGAVRDGWLILDAPIRQGSYGMLRNSTTHIETDCGDDHKLCWFCGLGASPGGVSDPKKWHIYLDTKSEAFASAATFALVSYQCYGSLIRIKGLILQNVDNATYKRVGIFEVSDLLDDGRSLETGLMRLKRVKIV